MLIQPLIQVIHNFRRVGKSVATRNSSR